MNIQGLRQTLDKGYDELLGSWAARRMIGAERLRIVRAQKKFWQQADEATLVKLLEFVEAEPYQELPPEEKEGVE